MWIAYCTQMLRGKDKSECFVSFLHQKLSLKNGQMLCAWQTDLVSRKTSGKPHTLNTGVTSGSTRSFYDSHAVIQTLGLEHCAANKNSYLQTLPLRNTKSCAVGRFLLSQAVPCQVFLRNLAIESFWGGDSDTHRRVCKISPCFGQQTSVASAYHYSIDIKYRTSSA